MQPGGLRMLSIGLAGREAECGVVDRVCPDWNATAGRPGHEERRPAAERPDHKERKPGAAFDAVQAGERRAYDRGRALVLALAILSGFTLAEEPKLRFPDLFHRLSHELVTPHIPWAKPFAGRKLKAVMIGPRWGHRETVELMERFDIECVPVMLQDAASLWCEGRHWGHEQVPSIWEDAVRKDIQNALEGSYDLIVMGQVPAKQFPPEFIELLLTKVKNGAGLVYLWPNHLSHTKLLNAFREGLSDGPDAVVPDAAALSPEGPDGEGDEDDEVDESDFKPDGGKGEFPKSLEFLTTGVPLEYLPGFGISDRTVDAPKVITVREVGKGRAVCVDYRGGSGDQYLTPADNVDLRYEYYQSFIIKAILTAARAEPNVVFEEFSPSVPGTELSFKVRNTGTSISVKIALAVRSPQALHRLPRHPVPVPGIGQTAPSLEPVHAEKKDLRLPKGLTPVRFGLPELPRGNYFLDVGICSEKGNLNWATSVLKVEPALGITDLRVEPEVIDLLTGDEHELRVAANLSAPAPGKASLLVAAIDNHDRLLSVKEVPIEEGAAAAETTLRVADIRSTLVKVRAEVRVGGRTADIRTAFVTTTHRDWDDFTFFCWGGVGGGYVGRHRGRVLAQLGVDAVRGGASIGSLRVADLRCIADLTRFNSAVEDKILQPCHNDFEFRKGLHDRVRDAVRSYSKFDVFGFMCGDEWGYMETNTGHDACWSEHCKAKFQMWLEERYETIGALNQQWDTRYESFEDIMPITAADARKQAKAKGDNYSPLIDQWVNNFETFADTFRFCAEAVRELDPHRRMGYSTPLWNWWYRGYNWPDIVPHCGFASPYGPWGDITHSEAARSFCKPGTVLSNHYGSYVTPQLHDEDHFRMVPYAILLNGFGNAFWYSTWGNEGGISPSLDPYPCLERSSESIREIKNGLDRLFLASKRLHDGIAIHYSMPCYLFSFLVSGPHVPWRMNSLIYALEELGYQFNFVSKKQIEEGALDDYRALILPVSQCIGTREAEQMKRFVENGGLLIADVKPGIADEHGKVGAQKTIPKLFGVKVGDPFSQDKKVKTRLSGLYRGREFSATEEKEVSASTSLSLDGARALVSAEGASLLTCHDVGKGAAICLGFPIYSMGGDLRNVLHVLLSAHGVTPPVNVHKSQEGFSPGAWIPGFELSRFSDGRASYFGFTRQRGEDRSAKLDFAFEAPTHLYDIRSAEYLGHVRQFPAETGPAQAKLYAALPYKVDGLRVTLAKETCSPGEAIAGVVEVLAQTDKFCRHVIHVEAVRPDGNTVRYLAQDLETRNGRAQIRLPLCLNEPAGEWTLTCTDVATKTRQTVSVTVLSPR